MLFVGMLKLWRIDDGVVWADEGEEEGDAGSDTERRADRGPNGTDLQLRPERILEQKQKLVSRVCRRRCRVSCKDEW